MLVYWAMFLLPATFALSNSRFKGNVWFLLGATLCLIIGLRFQVGGDWGSYRWQVSYHGQQTIQQIFDNGKEPLYRLLNWVAYRSELDVWLTNLVCAVIFVLGLVSFVRNLPEPFLALAASVPYLVIVVAMGYTRQAAAIGLVLLALEPYFRGRILTFSFYIFFAALFHRTSVFFFALAVVPYVLKRPLASVLLIPIGYILFQSVLAKEQEQLIYTYVDSSYATSSAGGFIRLLLNSCFAIVFIFLHRNFAITSRERGFWLSCSVVAVALVPLGLSLPTAADRLGVFLLPLQPLVVSHLPSNFSVEHRSWIRVSILLFFSLVMAVWLFYADNRFAWIPYIFWPLR